MGADPTTTDSEGSSLVHLSALFSNLSLLSYFAKTLNLDLNHRDKNGRTPLHLAAFEGKELSCTVLIALTTNLELVDNDGFTPLQLAAFSNNYRIIRHLIMRGASRTALSPNFTAEDIGNIMNISADVLELLKEPTCLKNINPVRPPLKEAKNSSHTFLLNLALFFCRYLVIVLIVYPYCDSPTVLLSGGIGLLGLTFLLCTFARNPGYKEQGGDLSDLYSKYPEDLVCAYCMIKKEKSMKHCQQCNRCVRKFDHHCPWIHNCVGER